MRCAVASAASADHLPFRYKQTDSATDSSASMMAQSQRLCSTTVFPPAIAISSASHCPSLPMGASPRIESIVARSTKGAIRPISAANPIMMTAAAYCRRAPAMLCHSNFKCRFDGDVMRASHIPATVANDATNAGIIDHETHKIHEKLTNSA